MSAYSDERSENWGTFVAIVFFVLGAFNVNDGLASLIQDDYFAADELLFGDLSTWGVLYLGLGVLQFLTAFLVFRGSAVGTLLGVVLVSFNAIVALLSIGAYPI